MSVMDAAPDINSRSQEQFTELKPNDFVSEVFLNKLENCSRGETKMPLRNQCPSPESTSNVESIDAGTNLFPKNHGASPINDDPIGSFSNADASMSRESPSTYSATSQDHGDGPSSDHCFDDFKTGEETAIVLQPDYLEYGKQFIGDSLVTFSSGYVNVKGSAVYGDGGTFDMKLEFDDIISIESQCSERVKSAFVKINVISGRAVQSETLHSAQGIEKLLFNVEASDWGKKLNAIISLNRIYKALWRIVGVEIEGYGEDFLDFHQPILNSYLPRFDETFEDVIYPEGDPDAVSISKRDVDLLQPDTFVNDTIIDFYIKFLKNKLQADEMPRFHFFNCFFFRKLADMDKDPSSAFEGKAAFLRVRKWTRKVNLFEKDFIFIPVNYNYHWSLIVICHPGEVANLKDEDPVKLVRVPCILHMDSLRGSHSGLKGLLQSYLWEEWRERHKEASEDTSSKFLNMRFISLELPQQQNLYDCGLFLLHYVECFLEDAPANFNPFRAIEQNSKFLKEDWFENREPYLKRSHIQKMIFGLLKTCSQETSPSRCRDDCSPSASLKMNNHNEGDAEISALSGGYQGKLPCIRSLKVVEMSSSLATSRHLNHARDLSLGSRECLVAGFGAGSLSTSPRHTFDQTSFDMPKVTLPPIKEEVDADENFIYTTTTEACFQHVDGISSAAHLHGLSSDFSPEVLPNTKLSADHAFYKDMSASHPATFHKDMRSAPVTTFCEPCSSDMNINQQFQSLENERELPGPNLTENMESFRDCFASGAGRILDMSASHCPVDSSDHNENEDRKSTKEKDRTQDGGGGAYGNVQTITDALVSETEVHHVAKKMRHMLPDERDIGFNLHL